MDAASPGALEAIFGVTQMLQLLLSSVLGFRLFLGALPSFTLGLSREARFAGLMEEG